MDIDGFVRANRPGWDRLDRLVSKARRRTSTLSADEVEELVGLYQRAGTHLSIARTRLEDPSLTAHLTGLVARSRAVLYGTRPRTWRVAIAFVMVTFPAAVWYARAFVGWSTLLFLAPAVAIAVWLAGSPAALELAAPEAAREAYVEEDFAAYYSSEPSAQFASEVSTNNIRVGALAFAGGILLCVPTVLILLLNGANGGVAAGLFAAAGEQARFWGLILPHGLLELTAVFVAGGAGLRLGWTLIDPGDRRRGDALVDEGRRAVTIVLGLVGVFLIAGLIEGFVTGSPLSTPVRVGIGFAAWAAVVAHVVVRGRDAAARGLTGALGEQDATAS